MPKLPEIYPEITAILDSRAMAVSPFDKNGPGGVTVHYLGEVEPERAHASLLNHKDKLGYHLVIDRAGKVWQFARMNQRVYHAGKALWNGRSPNRSHVAVAIASWGEVQPVGENYLAYTGRPVPRDEVACRRGNLSSELFYWHAATEAQEVALRRVLGWFKAMGIQPDDVVGHDECAIPRGRKVDPGGVLRLTMADLRAELSR